MGWEKGDETQYAKPQQDIEVLVCPGLRPLVVESVNIIDIDGDVGVRQMGAGGRGKKVADEHQPCGQNHPSRQSPFVVAQADQEPDEQQGQPAMKQRKPACEKWQLVVKHVAGQVQKVKPKQMAAEVHEPEALRQQNTHGTHADEQGAFQPHARYREKESGVTEP